MLGRKSKERKNDEYRRKKQMEKTFKVLTKLHKKYPKVVSSLAEQRVKLQGENSDFIEKEREGLQDRLDTIEIPYLRKRADVLESGKRKKIDAMERTYLEERQVLIFDSGVAIDKCDVELMKREVDLIKKNINK